MKGFRCGPHTSLDLLADSLWDGYQEGYRRRVVISIRQGRIAAVRPWDASYTGRDAQQIRLAGLTVLPGLIDAHVHLSLDGIDFQASLGRWRDPAAYTTALTRALRTSLEHGLVAIRDGGDGRGLNLLAREWVASGRCPGPRVIATGMAITRKGFYGSFLGPGTTDVSSLLELIAAQVSRGVDQVKVVVSGIITFRRLGEVGRLEFSPGELAAAVRLAHRMGRQVMAHVNSAAGVDLALAAGVDSVEHGYFLTTSQL
ncbi:MAG: hypothetical protein PWQ18_1064, partial [Clostridia bacterium]|nr:hypothetical protein [Clostridia bacterium]